MNIRIVTETFDPQIEEAAFAAGRSDMGGLVSFVGICRDDSGKTGSRLHIDHYPGFTEKEIARLAGGIADRFGCPDVLVIHRVGTIEPGEAIVLVAALSRHRAEAFQTVQTLMDYLKTDAPLWKKELDVSGNRWIEPRDQDYARRAEAAGDQP